MDSLIVQVSADQFFIVTDGDGGRRLAALEVAGLFARKTFELCSTDSRGRLSPHVSHETDCYRVTMAASAKRLRRLEALLPRMTWAQ